MQITKVKTATGVWRLNNTTSGNPRYRVQFDDHSWTTTAPDAQVAHRIVETIGVPYVFAFNDDNEITDASPAPPEPPALTVGRLREALRGVPADTPVLYEGAVDGREGRYETYTATAVAESGYDRSFVIS